MGPLPLLLIIVRFQDREPGRRGKKFISPFKKFNYMITIIHDTPSIAGNYLAELRDVTVQKNKVLFRRNIQRLGVFMAYELSKYLSFDIKKFKLP